MSKEYRTVQFASPPKAPALGPLRGREGSELLCVSPLILPCFRRRPRRRLQQSLQSSLHNPDLFLINPQTKN